MVVNNPLTRPSSLVGWCWAGALKFPWKCFRVWIIQVSYLRFSDCRYRMMRMAQGTTSRTTWKYKLKKNALEHFVHLVQEISFLCRIQDYFHTPSGSKNRKESLAAAQYTSFTVDELGSNSTWRLSGLLQPVTSELMRDLKKLLTKWVQWNYV